ncbi:MAG: hypothetical protein JNJ83_02380 [Verrucomicrobiaceae bacterium]|nr:hypothetical protein [Verrucomicrobiaceae bacterium]
MKTYSALHSFLALAAWLMILDLNGLHAQTAGKIVVYKETLELRPTDQRGDMKHTNDLSGLTKANWSTSTQSTKFTNYRVMDIVNNRQAVISYFSETGKLGKKTIVYKRFSTSPAETSIPISRIPIYPSPSEQWIYIYGGEDVLRHQTAGEETSTEADDQFEPGVDTQPTDPTKSPDGRMDSFGLNGSTFLWNGRAQMLPITLAASQVAESQVADADKAVYASVMVQSGLEVRSYMLSNYDRDPAKGFPGHTFTLQTVQPSRGLMVVDRVMTFNANEIDADASGSLVVRTVENAVELIRADLINQGYVQVFE